MNLETLREEFRRELIGIEWLDAVRRVCRSVVVKYPPEIYATSANWEDSLEDLVQDVVANSLIRDGQAQYLMDVCATTDDLRNLLARQVAHVLARGRRRTVIDQLLSRSRKLLAQPPFERVGRGLYTLAGAPEEATRGGFRDAVAIVRSASRVPYHGTERAPTVFTTETLRAVLIAVVSAHGPTSTRNFSEILSDGLTAMLPPVLGQKDGSQSEPSIADPEDELHVQEAVTQVLETLSTDELNVLRWKLLGASDADVAARTGVSRPTAAARKQEMLSAVRDLLEGVPPSLQDRTFDELTVRLCLPTLPVGYVQADDA